MSDPADNRFYRENPTLTLTRDEALRLQAGLADVLCWVDGFKAGREGTDLGASGPDPDGLDAARDLNAKLRSII